MARMVKRLRNLDIDEVSLVDRPANQHGLVAIAKRDEESTMSVQPMYDAEGYEVDPSELEHGDYAYDADGNEYVNVLDEDIDDDEYYDDDDYDDGVGKAFGDTARLSAMYGRERAGRAGARLASRGESGARRAGGAARNLPRREQEAFNRARNRSAWRSSSAIATGGLTGPTRAGSAVGSARDKAWDVASNRRVRYGAYGAGAGAVGGGAAYAGSRGRRKSDVGKSYGESVLEELSKSYGDDARDAVVSKALDELAETSDYYVSKADALEEQIAQMQAESEYGEYVELAKSYGYAPGEVEEVADMIYDVATNAPEQLGMLDRVLTSQSSIAKSFLAEQGMYGGAESDAMAQVSAMADEAVAKGDGHFSVEQAVTELFSANPAMYDEYESDNRF